MLLVTICEYRLQYLYFNIMWPWLYFPWSWAHLFDIRNPIFDGTNLSRETSNIIWNETDCIIGAEARRTPFPSAENCLNDVKRRNISILTIIHYWSAIIFEVLSLLGTQGGCCCSPKILKNIPPLTHTDPSAWLGNWKIPELECSDWQISQCWRVCSTNAKQKEAGAETC